MEFEILILLLFCKLMTLKYLHSGIWTNCLSLWSANDNTGYVWNWMLNPY